MSVQRRSSSRQSRADADSDIENEHYDGGGGDDDGGEDDGERVYFEPPSRESYIEPPQEERWIAELKRATRAALDSEKAHLADESVGSRSSSRLPSASRTRGDGEGGAGGGSGGKGSTPVLSERERFLQYAFGQYRGTPAFTTQMTAVKQKRGLFRSAFTRAQSDLEALLKRLVSEDEVFAWLEGFEAATADDAEYPGAGRRGDAEDGDPASRRSGGQRGAAAVLSAEDAAARKELLAGLAFHRRSIAVAEGRILRAFQRWLQQEKQSRVADDVVEMLFGASIRSVPQDLEFAVYEKPLFAKDEKKHAKRRELAQAAEKRAREERRQCTFKPKISSASRSLAASTSSAARDGPDVYSRLFPATNGGVPLGDDASFPGIVDYSTLSRQEVNDVVRHLRATQIAVKDRLHVARRAAANVTSGPRDADEVARLEAQQVELQAALTEAEASFVEKSATGRMPVGRRALSESPAARWGGTVSPGPSGGFFGPVAPASAASSRTRSKRGLLPPLPRASGSPGSSAASSPRMAADSPARAAARRQARLHLTQLDVAKGRTAAAVQHAGADAEADYSDGWQSQQYSHSQHSQYSHQHQQQPQYQYPPAFQTAQFQQASYEDEQRAYEQAQYEAQMQQRQVLQLQYQQQQMQAQQMQAQQAQQAQWQYEQQMQLQKLQQQQQMQQQMQQQQQQQQAYGHAYGAQAPAPFSYAQAPQYQTQALPPPAVYGGADDMTAEDLLAELLGGRAAAAPGTVKRRGKESKRRAVGEEDEF